MKQQLLLRQACYLIPSDEGGFYMHKRECGAWRHEYYGEYFFFQESLNIFADRNQII